MKIPTLLTLAGAAWFSASAASSQPTPLSQSTQTAQLAQSTQVISSTPTVQPVQPTQLATTPLPAQPVKPPKPILYGDPCRSDLERFCVGSQPQAIRIRCLDSHEAEFSKACQERRAELRDLRTACAAVIEPSCRYVPLFADAILNCLQEHEAELVAPCKSLREKAQKPSHYIAAACQSDFKKFCKDMPLNGFRVAQCLQEHEAELSKPCLEGAPGK